MMTVTLRHIEERFRETGKLVSSLVAQWETLLPTIGTPQCLQFVRWLRIQCREVTPILHGIERVAVKSRWQGLEHSDHAVRYVSACANSYRKSAVGRAA